MHHITPAAPHTAPPPPLPEEDPRARRARQEMVARLEADQPLDPVVREALLALRLDVLIPRAYVRQVPDGVEPGVWKLLDGAHPEDREEWIKVLYSGDSVRVQHDGERLDGQQRGVVTGGRITSLTSVMSMTAAFLGELQPQRGQSFLDLGSGPGVTGAAACLICGPERVTLVDRDPHLVEAVLERLAPLGLRPRAVTGDGYAGAPAFGPYDRVLSGFAVEAIPPHWLEQLANGGRLLTTITTRSPSWPGRAVVEKTTRGRVKATLRGVRSGHRPAHGLGWLTVLAHRERIAAEPGSRRNTSLAPPDESAYGLWLALDHLAPGLVRDYQAEHLTLVAPDENSWVVVRPAADGNWMAESVGDRLIWAEVEEVHARWVAAGEPTSYRLEIAADGTQHVTSATGPAPLEWALSAPAAPGIPAPPQERS
ncbi:protein-L-isoaspartate O-methyltransferase family protein [Streptomyces noursei]|uniref:protein-L-isoaspartate O-methyltransferase family protein n=1 Tax=Streptomyces noursei TaxID=1971 RepID=UPI00380C73EB